MRTALVCALLMLGVLPQSRTSGAPFDILILNGHLVDGTGSPWYAADVGIRNGRVAAIGRLRQGFGAHGQLTGAAAKQTIDASGRVVAPGFIDMLGQSELTVLVNPHLPSKITDLATFAQPNQLSVGLPGKILRGPAAR